ncbi:hypothetical protein [uncultured Chloroflexus sp.]|uniref:hypothetical protein n=1 Tax=uncultured Chloroflexus sp. TaxID=214040 RepID=UPI0026399CE4|nr:hypothetical protein [uncultured Chloroflexus sp.]
MNKIAELQNRMNAIDNMRRPTAEHRNERADKQRLLATLQRQFADINALLGNP